MDEQNNSFLITEKVGKLMSKYAIPCIISLLVGALYNIVDQIFIANADYLASYGNGEGGFFNNAFYGTRVCIWCRFCTFAADFLRA